MKKVMMITMISILFCNLLCAPPSNSGCIFASEGINPFENLYKAVCEVESSGNPFAIGDKHLKNWSYGIAQIRETRLSDYFNRTGIRYATSDMFDTVKSKEVFMYYCSQFKPHEIESISRAWNGGGNWRQKKSTKDYYWKVQKFLNRYKSQSKPINK